MNEDWKWNNSQSQWVNRFGWCVWCIYIYNLWSAKLRTTMSITWPTQVHLLFRWMEQKQKKRQTNAQIERETKSYRHSSVVKIRIDRHLYSQHLFLIRLSYNSICITSQYRLFLQPHCPWHFIFIRFLFFFLISFVPFCVCALLSYRIDRKASTSDVDWKSGCSGRGWQRTSTTFQFSFRFKPSELSYCDDFTASIAMAWHSCTPCLTLLAMCLQTSSLEFENELKVCREQCIEIAESMC